MNFKCPICGSSVVRMTERCTTAHTDFSFVDRNTFEEGETWTDGPESTYFTCAGMKKVPSSPDRHTLAPCMFPLKGQTYQQLYDWCVEMEYVK